MRAYYKTTDGKIRDIVAVEEGSSEEEQLVEMWGSEVDDRTNFFCFKGFEYKNPRFIKLICEAMLKKIGDK